MKAAALIALSAALLLCGCTVTPQSEENLKPVAREYEDESSAAPVIETVVAEKDDAEPEFGQPLVYKDLCTSNFDFLAERLNDQQNLYTYSFFSGYDESGEWYGSPYLAARMSDGDKKEDILAEYGAEAFEYDPQNDPMVGMAEAAENKLFLANASHFASYCDVIYPLPDRSLPFGQYAGLRLYFDKDDDLIVSLFFINHDLMPLYQIDLGVTEPHGEGYEMPKLPEVEGETFIPRVMLHGMENYDWLYADIAYPCLRFEDGMVTVNWYGIDGNSAEGEGVLKDGATFHYTMNENGIDFELPAEGDSMATYISYNSYLDAYELHDPYWRDNYNCTLLLGRSVRREVGGE